MKALLTSIAAAVALSSGTVLRAAIDDLPNQDILNDEAFSQELNQNAGGQQFGKMEKDASGVLMHGNAAYIVQKLGQQLTLPDGTTVQPDGSMLGPDGMQKSLRSGEMLSIDGAVKSAPFTNGGQAPSGKLPSQPLSTDSDSYNKNNTETTPPLTSAPGTQDTKTNDQTTTPPPEADFQD